MVSFIPPPGRASTLAWSSCLTPSGPPRLASWETTLSYQVSASVALTSFACLVTYVPSSLLTYIILKPGPWVIVNNEKSFTITSIILNQTRWCDHSFESSRWNYSIKDHSLWFVEKQIYLISILNSPSIYLALIISELIYTIHCIYAICFLASTCAVKHCLTVLSLYVPL